MGGSSSTTYTTSEQNRADEMYRHCQKLEALRGKLRQSNEELNSDFYRYHQTLTGQINNLNAITCELEETGNLAGSANRIAAVLDLGLTKPMIQHLSTIYYTIQELQQMNTLRGVRSAEMSRIAKTLILHNSLNCRIDALLLNLDYYKITGQNKSETLIHQMRETAAQFQKTVNEIKHTKDYINTLV